MVDPHAGTVRRQDLVIRGAGVSAVLSEGVPWDCGSQVAVIDASGKVVIPGFVACHNHLYSSVVRSIPASGYDNVDYSFISWMERFCAAVSTPCT